jgi:hypothetical protein
MTDIDGLQVCFKCRRTYDFNHGTQKNCSIVEIALKCPLCGYVEIDSVL